jgi:xylose dehydrogenase (NAD/NADP)
VSAETRGEGPFADVDRLSAMLVSYGDVTGSFTAEFDGQPDDRLSIVGDAGRLSIENAFEPRTRRRITVSRGDRSTAVEPGVVDEIREEFEYFAHAVLTDGPIEPDGRDGLTDVRTMAAVLDAARDGRRVDVDPARDS